jgi:hypothetical protein
MRRRISGGLWVFVIMTGITIVWNFVKPVPGPFLFVAIVAAACCGIWGWIGFLHLIERNPEGRQAKEREARELAEMRDTMSSLDAKEKAVLASFGQSNTIESDPADTVVVGLEAKHVLVFANRGVTHLRPNGGWYVTRAIMLSPMARKALNEQAGK